MGRVRKANEKAIANTLRFLEDLQIKKDVHAGSYDVTISELYKFHKISKSTFSVCKKLEFVNDRFDWLVGDPTREMALRVLEILRQQASKRIDVVLSDDFVTAIDRLTTSMNTLSIQNESGLNRIKSPMLGRALNQVEQNHGNHLFSQVESDESKKFELLKAIASGYYSQSPMLTHEIGNDWIMTATEDLFNKFFKVK